jgi:hypothetical protein
MKLDILEMLTYRRPAWTKTESQFIRKYIDSVPGIYADRYGNRILNKQDARVMIACHTDTVHMFGGQQRVIVKNGIARLPAKSTSNCLGADNTAGIYAALRLIELKVPATFIFHRAEEIGGQGSTWLAEHYPEWLSTFDICLSLDRRGTSDIITSQFGQTTASVEFAAGLSDALGMNHKPCAGVFTDSANYAHLIPECSNLSMGTAHEHFALESLDLDYLERVIGRLAAVDWDKLPIERFNHLGDDPSASEWNIECDLEEYRAIKAELSLEENTWSQECR